MVLPTSDGARLETGDNSCVTPSDLFGDASGVIRNDAAVRPINAFSNSQYTGANVDDPEQNALDRTREGYIEVFEMGIVADATMTGFIKHRSRVAPWASRRTVARSMPMKVCRQLRCPP